MKQFHDLTQEQQAKATQLELNSLLSAICEGAVRFNDKLNGDDLQARIDAAFAKAEQMRTPWFAHDYIMDTCREDLEGMAQCTAEDAFYTERGEHVINGVANVA